MLASITPLGERSRGSSWSVTAFAFALGAVAGGAALGALAGLVGSALPAGWQWRGVLVLLAAVLALAYDVLPSHGGPPSTRRQVNEDWLTRYRGWVHGLGFGAQLGAGVLTMVSSAATYAAIVAGVLSGTLASGAIVGAAFGAVRAVSIVPAGRVHDWPDLQRLHRGLLGWQQTGRLVSIAIETGAVVLLVAAAT